MTTYLPEGMRLHTMENQTALQSVAALQAAMHRKQILEARAIVCDAAHNLIVELPHMRGIIPREEGAIGIAEGTTREIALIAKAGKPVCFQVQELTTDADGVPLAILSRRQAQLQCWQEFLSHCTPGDVLPARVTHMEKFGCFVDIGCGIPSMIPIDCISVSRISHPSDRFTLGQTIQAVVTSVSDFRIGLSHKELLGTWMENAAKFAVGETVSGIVRSVESYGIFVELTPNLAGLAEPKEHILPKQRASVYIKAIIPEKMKIKLVLIDAFPDTESPNALSYFVQEPHLSTWNYSPIGATKQIQTQFDVC